MGNYSPDNITLVTQKVMEKNLLERFSKHMKVEELARNNYPGFSRTKSCWTNLVDFYNDGNSLVDDSRATAIVYLDLRKASDTVSQLLTSS